MKKFQTMQAGFGAVAVLFVVLFVAVVGFTGYKMVTMHKSNASADTSTQGTAKAAVVPKTITSKADLQATAHALDNAGASLDSSMDDSSLSSDVNAML